MMDTVKSQANAQSARGAESRTCTPSGTPEHHGGTLKTWGVSYDTESWGNRGKFGQWSRQGQNGLQDHRIPEVRGWEAEVRGLHMDPTEEDEFCSRREVGTKGWKNILVQRLIDTVRK